MSEVEDLKALLEEDEYSIFEVGDEYDGFKNVSHELVDTSRWYENHKFVAQAPSGKFYQWSLQLGATEHQDNEPFDGKLTEVRPALVTVVKYVKV